jgi:hypothetical protein
MHKSQSGRPAYKPKPGKYSLLMGSLDGRPDVTKSKPSTIRNVVSLSGESQTFIVQTYRVEDGDYCFIEYLDDEGTLRLALPPRVMRLLARQRDQLTLTLRKKRGKSQAAARKAAGKLPAFLRGKSKDA